MMISALYIGACYSIRHTSSLSLFPHLISLIHVAERFMMHICENFLSLSSHLISLRAFYLFSSRYSLAPPNPIALFVRCNPQVSLSSSFPLLSIFRSKHIFSFFLSFFSATRRIVSKDRIFFSSQTLLQFPLLSLE